MDDTPKRRRMGQFTITCDCIREDWQKLLHVFAHFVIVRAQMHYDTDSIHYVAHSDLFDEIGLVERVPEYFLTVEFHDMRKPPRVQAFRRSEASEQAIHDIFGRAKGALAAS